jgi:hypothetical protein
VVPGEQTVAHMLFEAAAAKSDLHRHVFTQDQLFAEFVLTNGETGAQQIVRSPGIATDLAD